MHQKEDLPAQLNSDLGSLWALNSRWATEIEQDTDLNNLKTAGSYYSPSEITSKTLKNSPVTSYGFTLKVENSTGNDPEYIRQILMSRTNVHMRAMNGADNWLGWVEK